MLPADGQTKRRLVPDAVASIDIGPSVKHCPDYLELALARGDPEGGDAYLVFRINVGPLREHGFYCFRVAIADGRPKRIAGFVLGMGRGGKYETGYQRNKYERTLGQHVLSLSPRLFSLAEFGRKNNQFPQSARPVTLVIIPTAQT